MNAKMIVTTGRTKIDEIFGGENSISHTVELIIDDKSIANIPNINIDAMYEIFDIDDTEEQFMVDCERLNYVLVKYGASVQLNDLKRILRPIITNNIKEITIEKRGIV